MIGYNKWSYAPYRPPLTDVGDIYICRIAPGESSIEINWLPLDNRSLYEVLIRVRGEGDFYVAAKTERCKYLVTGLADLTDYEFFVRSENKTSRIRLARTGKAVGTVVNYLHPDDEAYAYSGRYLCSPSLVRHPEGFLLASMDVYAQANPQNLTLIFRSDDDGESWQYVSELTPCYWGEMFIHKGELYMLAVSTEYGDLLIGKSTDGGKSFSTPVTLLRGFGGKNGSVGVHRYPQNVFRYGGRIYNTLEWGAWANKEYGHAAMVMSADEDSDLMKPESWSFTEPRRFDNFSEELAGLPKNTMTIEGNIVLSPDGRLLNIMRFGKRGYAICYEVNREDHEAQLNYASLIPFNANFSKFSIKYDPVSKKYYSIASKLYDGCPDSARNLLALLSSDDLKSWRTVCNLIDRRDADVKLVGFQYVDFEFEGDDIIYLCRTAINGANSFHDSNFSTFHRVKNFREL